MAEFHRTYAPSSQKPPRKPREHWNLWTRARPFAALLFGVQIVGMVVAIAVIFWGSPLGTS